MKPDAPCPTSAHRRRCLQDGPGLARALLVSGLLAPPAVGALTPGGELGITSDAIYRGLSESFGRPALLVDLHASTEAGTFAGVFSVGTFTSTSNRAAPHDSLAELTGYLGQRFKVGGSWSAQLTLYEHHYPDGFPGDYQEVSASLSYLDLWSFSVSAIPNAPRYTPPIVTNPTSGTLLPIRTGRYPAWVAATQLQWLVTSGLFLTAGAGYYYMQGGSGAGYTTSWGTVVPDAYLPDQGYAYGNAGFAYQWRGWRLDAGYFLVGDGPSTQVYRFPPANRHVAATLSWHF
jgi:hypothetical protein